MALVATLKIGSPASPEITVDSTKSSIRWMTLGREMCSNLAASVIDDWCIVVGNASSGLRFNKFHLNCIYRISVWSWVIIAFVLWGVGKINYRPGAIRTHPFPSISSAYEQQDIQHRGCAKVRSPPYASHDIRLYRRQCWR